MKKVISSLVISGLCANGTCFGMNEDLAKNEVEAITEKAGKNLMVKEIKRAEKNNRKVRTVLGISIAAAGSAFAYHYLRATKNPTVNVSVSKISGNRIVSPELPSFDTVRSLTKVLNFAKSYPTATSLPTIGGLASIAVATAYFIKKKSADSGKVEDRACIPGYISDSETSSENLSDEEDDGTLSEGKYEYEDSESETSSENLSDEEDESASPGGAQTLQNQGEIKCQLISITTNGKPKTLIKSEAPMKDEQKIYQELTELNKELNKDWASLSGSEMDLAKFRKLDSEFDSILDKLKNRGYISKCVYDEFSQVKKKKNKLFDENFVRDIKIFKNSVYVTRNENPSTEETEVFQELTKLTEDWTSLSNFRMDLAKFRELDSKFDSILNELKDRDYISKCVDDKLSQVYEKRKELFRQNFIEIIKICGNSVCVMNGNTPSTEETEVFRELTELNEDWTSVSNSRMDLAKFRELDSKFDSILNELKDRDYISKCVYDKFSQVKKKKNKLFDENFVKDIKICKNSVYVMKGDNPSTEETEVFKKSVDLLEKLNKLSGSEVELSKFKLLFKKFRSISYELKDRGYISKCVDDKLSEINPKINELRESIDNRNKTSGKNDSERSASQIPLFRNTNNIRGHKTVYVNSSSAIKREGSNETKLITAD